MSLSARVTETPPPSNHGMPCSVGQLINTLEGDELAALLTMLGDPHKRDGWSASAIYDALVAEGHKVGYQTIGRHRGGKCRCGR